MSAIPSSSHLVLIPSYNSGALVLRTVRDALEQWAPVWVVVDGGQVVGTIVIILLPEVLRSSSIESLKFMQKWYLVFFGLAVVALMIWLPGGILSIADRFRKREAPR